MLAKRKEQYWGPERNARRRAIYATDPEYAEKARAARRASHAMSTGKKPNVSCIVNLNKVDKAGALMAVSYDGSPLVIGRVLTQSDCARLLNRQPQVIYRWHQRGIFPAPALKDDRGSTFYADVEIKLFVAILGEHQFITPHFRIDHTVTRDRLYAAAFINNPVLAVAWLSSRIG